MGETLKFFGVNKKMISEKPSVDKTPRVQLWNDVHKAQRSVSERIHAALLYGRALINLPTGRQTFDFDCGPKALQLVMAYYGFDIREDKLLRELKTDSNGTTVENLVSYARKNGFGVFAECGVLLERVKEFLDAGRPVIVLVQAWATKHMTLEEWGKDYDDGHYVVLIGYHDDIFIFQDPSSFKRTWMTEPEFLARWHDLCPKTWKKYDQFAMTFFGKAPENKAFEHMD